MLRISLLAIALLLAVPTAAPAKLVVPDVVVPGETVVIDAGVQPTLLNASVRLLADVTDTAYGQVTVGTVAVAGDGRATATFVMPETFTCHYLCEGERRFFPGQTVSVAICSVPETGPQVPGLLTSSQVCLGGRTTVGGRARVWLNGRSTPRRVGRMNGARWSDWGGAVARGRGLVGRRAVVATASGIVECDGRLWYGTAELRRRGRVVQLLTGLAPC